MIGDRQNSTRQIKLIRPKVKEWFFAGSAHLPGHSGKGCDPAAVLTYFHDPGGNELP
jgi:hypothetical protein